MAAKGIRQAGTVTVQKHVGPPPAQVLEACCACSSMRAAQAAALQAVRAGLQGAAAAGTSASGADEGVAGGRHHLWAEACALRAIPVPAAEVHALMRSGGAADLDADALQVGALRWLLPFACTDRWHEKVADNCKTTKDVNWTPP